MTSATPAQARWAVAASFLLMGLLIGAWVPHVPLAKERLGVGPGMFGLALLAIAICFAGLLACGVGLIFATPVAYLSSVVAYRWLQYGHRAALDHPGTTTPMLTGA